MAPGHSSKHWEVERELEGRGSRGSESRVALCPPSPWGRAAVPAGEGPSAFHVLLPLLLRPPLPHSNATPSCPHWGGFLSPGVLLLSRGPDEELQGVGVSLIRVNISDKVSWFVVN